MDKTNRILIAMAVICSHVMCAAVAFSYSNMLCAVSHGETSAPAGVAFLLAIPFGVIIGVLLGVACFRQKSKKERKRLWVK